MRIAFITQCKPVREMGGARAQMDLAEELASRGCSCVVLGPDEILALMGGADLQDAFWRWLRTNGDKFDVVDVDHYYMLPNREEVSATVLLVARSVLFIPFVPLLLAEDHASFGAKLRQRWEDWRARGRSRFRTPFHSILRNLRRCDVLNVSNTRDALLARSLGVPEERVLCLPYGLDPVRREALASVARERRAAPRFVFLGTFEARKGSRVLPLIWERLAEEFPEARLSLLGVKLPNEDATATIARVRRSFGEDLAARIDVTPVFKNGDLPGLLAACGVGIFPSRHEGLPFAVLEQLQAGVPVAGFDAPGACDVLPAEWRCAPDEPLALAEIAARLMRERLLGDDVVSRALETAGKFKTEEIAMRTLEVYSRMRNAR